MTRGEPPSPIRSLSSRHSPEDRHAAGSTRPRGIVSRCHHGPCPRTPRARVACDGGSGSGLVAAATLLSPWRLKFAIDARELYKDLYPQAAAQAETEALGWLATAGYSYQALREENAPKVRTMSQVSAVLGVLMVVQTLAWLAALAVD
jgi:hypothetical protein